MKTDVLNGNVFHSFFGASIILLMFSEDFQTERNMLSRRAIPCKHGKNVEIRETISLYQCENGAREKYYNHLFWDVTGLVRIE